MSTNETLKELGEAVEELAYSLFNRCGDPDDYCVQHTSGGGNVVFGGTNRMILSKRGWSIDRGYCTPRFKAAWDLLWEEKDCERRTK